MDTSNMYPLIEFPVQYARENEIYKFHFPGDPITPGAQLVGDFFKMKPTQLRSEIWKFKFRKPVRPGKEYTFSFDSTGAKLTADDGVYFTATPREGDVERQQFACQGVPTKSSKLDRGTPFTYYKNFFELDETRWVTIDVREILSGKPQISSFGNPTLFVITECAGNLALEGVADQRLYKFLEFNDFFFNESHESRLLQISSTILSKGSFLSWRFSAFDESGVTVASSTKAISI
ncbi:hypothetical protein HT746_24975 [Burkholderia pyrrocinia]|uniref:hypothetical protein n=1 Tax=Burkholderia pyrrocinia TaxID=60550 RepID=UPI001577051A|nr:hypothetical protein [Burkholderia pyrrocinia]NTX30330.1 hypothetical protein [Burkholderia pyrrocinia]